MHYVGANCNSLTKQSFSKFVFMMNKVHKVWARASFGSFLQVYWLN